MIHLDEAIIVEGKYDKIKLSSFLDAVIIETGGFAIFKDKEQLAMIRKLAEVRGVILLTDSDAAGFKIRAYLKGALPKNRVKHVYIPDVFGKEHRKAQPSKEGKLGVEGIQKEMILESLKRAGITLCESADCESVEKGRRITKADLFEDGLTGGPNSHHLRLAFLQELGLPSRLSANMLIDVLNAMMTYDEYKECVPKIADKEE